MNRDDAQRILETAVGDGSHEFGSFFLSRLFGMKVAYEGELYIVSFEVKQFLYNPQSSLHGGVLATALDTVPFGWRVGEDGALMEVPQQQATIQQILTLRREGLSLRSIAAKIGGTVSHVTVKNILAQAGPDEGLSSSLKASIDGACG
jgi:hypothetical protein